MNPFDPADLAEPTTNAFAPEDLAEETGPSPFAEEDLAEPKKEPERGTSIPLARIEEIAKKHGVPKEELVAIAPAFNASVEGTEGLGLEDAAQALGFVSESVGMGIAPFIYKKLQSENKEAAIDELREEAEARKSRLMQGAELAAGLGSAIGLGRGVAKLATKAASGLEAAQAAKKVKDLETAYDVSSAIGGGATTGLTGSKQGEELRDTAIGAGLGAGLMALAMSPRAAKSIYKKISGAGEEAVEGVAKEAAKSATKATKAEQGIAEDLSQVFEGEGGRNIVERIEKEWAANSFPEAQRKEQVLSDEILPEDESLASGLASKTRRDELLDPFRKEGLSTGNVAEPVETLSLEKIADDRKRFASWIADGELGGGASLSNDEALKIIKDVTKQQGVPNTSKLWDEFRKAEIAKTILQKEADEAAPAVAKGWFQNAALKVLDGRQYAARLIDEKLGTRFTNKIDDISKANNQFTYTLSAFSKKIDDIEKQIKKLDVDEKQLYSYLDTGAPGNLNPEQIQVANTYKDLMESARKRAADLGTFIDKREHYVRHQMKDLPKVLDIFSQQFEKLKKMGINVTGEGVTPEQYDKMLASPAALDLIKSVAYFTGNKVPKEAEEFTALARSALDAKRGGDRWATRATAALERKAEEVPELIRETNATKLARNWVHNTFRHAYLHPHLTTVKLYRQMAKDAGDEVAEKYLDSWIKDMAGGVREGTLRKAAQDKVTEVRKAILAKLRSPDTGPVARAGYKFLYDTPDFFPILTNQVYPNLLGWRAKAVVTNLMQPITAAWPELGGKYGAARTASAYSNVLKTLASGKEIVIKNADVAEALGSKIGETVTTRDLGLILANEGNIQKQWNSELASALHQGIADTAPVKLSNKALQRVNNVGMFLYEKSEVINRMVSAETAKGIAKDLMKANSKEGGALAEGATKFFQNIDKGYRAELIKSIKAGNVEELEKKLTDYLIGKTVFNYNRASLNEFGRSMGPILTTFTKWPVSVAGDMLLEYQKKGGEASKVLAQRYLAPLATLLVLQKLEEAAEGPRGRSDFAKQFVGPGSLGSFASVGSVGSILSGEIAKPPAIAALTGLAGGALSGDAEQSKKALWSWANDVTQSYAPGAGAIRFFLQDAPVLFEGKQKKQGRILDVLGEELK